MLRIIDGRLFEGKPSPDTWQVTLRRLGNGHAEASARRPIHWTECDLQGVALQHAIESHAACDAEAQEERDEANRRRAARRAKTDVRLKIKAAGMDALLTLTYRENQQQLELAKRHMKEFVRRMRRVLPGWQYVAAFERQKRGAWHVHMATHRLPKELPASNGVKVKSFNIVRAIWRSVTGELGGNIDQAKRKHWTKQTCAKLAAYVSKYMLKAFEDGDKWSNRYSASAGLQVPPAELMEFRGVGLADIIGLLFDDIAQGACQCMTWLSDFGDCFFLSTERPG